MKIEWNEGPPEALEVGMVVVIEGEKLVVGNILLRGDDENIHLMDGGCGCCSDYFFDLNVIEKWRWFFHES